MNVYGCHVVQLSPWNAVVCRYCLAVTFLIYSFSPWDSLVHFKLSLYEGDGLLFCFTLEGRTPYSFEACFFFLSAIGLLLFLSVTCFFSSWNRLWRVHHSTLQYNSILVWGEWSTYRTYLLDDVASSYASAF